MQENFSSSFTVEDIQNLNKYFLTCDNIKEILEEILPLITTNIILIEKENNIILSIPIPSKKNPICEFKVLKKDKTGQEQISDTYKILNELTTENNKLKSIIEDLKAKVETLSNTTLDLQKNPKILNQFLDFLHPIGSFFLSSDSKNPSEIFGGKWEKVSDLFLVGAGNKYTLNSTGGEETHILTKEEMPSHSHVIEPLGRRFAWGGDFTQDGPASGNGWRSQLSNHVTSVEGGGKAHNNIPPYLAVFIWKRIA